VVVTPADLKSARTALGLSAEGFARLVRVESGRTVRRWEAGERDIPGPVQVLVDLLLALPAARGRCGVTDPDREPAE
jgi:DNA-binding transcriptional regulator YiaG